MLLEQKPENAGEGGIAEFHAKPHANGRTSQHAVTILCFYYYPAGGGGADRLMQRVAEVLAGRGWRMTVLTQMVPGAPKGETINGVSVRRVFTLSMPGARFITYMFSAFWQQVVQRDASQVVHLNQLYLHVPLAIWLRRLRGPRVVLRIACGGLYSDILRARRLPLGLGRWVLGAARQADGVISLTDQITEELCAAGFDRQRIVQIPNGIDLARFASVSPGQRAELRRQLGLPTNQVVTLFAGRLEPEKAVDVLLHAWKVVQASQPQALLVLAGTGSLRAKLEALSRDLGLENSVRFIGYVDRMLPLYQSADVFVLPSLAEGISNALLEAMACGLVPVATAIPGNTDVVTDGRDGLLVGPGAEADLAAALERVISDTALRTSLAEAALQTISARFTLEQTALCYADLYQQVATGTLKRRIGDWQAKARGES